MNRLITVAVAALIALPVLAHAEPAKKPHRAHHAAPTARSHPVAQPSDYTAGNAALGGNNASSASGSNSAGENANGRSGGGFGN